MLITLWIVVWAAAIFLFLVAWSRIHARDRDLRGIDEGTHVAGFDEVAGSSLKRSSPSGTGV
jgi:hypothetical protein